MALFILLMAGQTAYTYADTYIPHLEVSKKNYYFTAGKQNQLTLVLSNSGGYDIFEVQTILTSNTPGITILSNAQKVINIIKYNQNSTYQALIDVDQNVALGVYVLQMQLKYLSIDTPETLNIPISIVVNQQFQPMVELRASPKKLVSGGSNEVIVTVANIASVDLTDITLSLSTASPYLAIERPFILNATTIKVGEKTSFTVRIYALESTPLGSYALTAATSYSSEAGDNYRQVATLPLEATSPVITKVPVLIVTNLNTTSAVPGQRFTIHASVNCYDASIYNAKATIILDAAGFLRPLGPTSVSLGEMNPGDSREVSCVVLVDGTAVATPIPTTLSLSYTDLKGVQRVTTEAITVQVGQITDFRITEMKLINAEQGTTVEVESSLVLIGTSKAQFTNVEVIPDSNVSTLPESSYYLGTLNPGNPVSFTLKFDISSDAAIGNAAVKLRVSYLDNLNTPHQQLLDYSIKIKPAATIFNNFWGWLRHIFGME
jgi:hypothetical protein